MSSDGLDNGPASGDASAMSESPYAIPVEDLVSSARVPIADQVEEQSRYRWFDPSSGPLPWADGTAGDADGE